MAMGVRMGKTSLWKRASMSVCACCESSLGLTKTIPASASLGSKAARPCDCLATSSCTRAEMADSCSPTVIPSGPISSTSPVSCCLSPATRTMKNSSRLLATMAWYFKRSSSGTASLSASAMTRALNSSHESSRLR
jgi:hypothetical protein